MDVGCGTGTNLVTLVRSGWQVTGIDYIWLAVNKARRKLQDVGAQGDIILNDVIKLDFLKEKFDLILDIGCFHG